MTLDQIRNGKTDLLGHSSIQPWSAGAHFPGVIVRVEYYETHADYIERLLRHTPPAECPRFPMNSEQFYAQPLEQRFARAGHRAIYKDQSRLFLHSPDTYAEAAHWIACLKEFDEEAPAIRAAEAAYRSSGIYEGELQGMAS